jgi:hypothetical protein
LFMNATTYTGTGAAASVANGAPGASFQPDLVWIKARNDTTWNQVFDSVRGVNKGIYTNDTYQETTQTDAFNSFNSNGMGLGADAAGGSVNKSGNTYVGWQWKAGGTAVSNTAGSITSSVSANTTSGFSVVTYTGNGSAGATVGHGLGVAPSMIITKQRNGAENWQVYHSSLGATKRLFLNLTNAEQATTAAWNDTAPTSSVFSLGTSNAGNGNTNTYVAYCWAAIAGYSAFGSYTGNASTDGPFIYTGFRPRWFFIKCSSTAGENSMLYDTSVDPYNASQEWSSPNLSDASNTAGGYFIDFLSNGIKIRQAGPTGNASGRTYIYAAFAENPFKYANAR